MPRYFFDTDTGEIASRDDVGLDLPDLDAAVVEAIGLLQDLVRSAMPEGERLFAVDIRDEHDVIVYRGEMVIHGQRFK